MFTGLITVVPSHLLSLLSAHELERRICGSGAGMDIDLLERMTHYSGCSATDPHVVLFWRMLRERFDDDLRARFLVFVWGRSRLPLVEKDFDCKFKLQSHTASITNAASKSADSYLPQSHTCFFALELPQYSSMDVMSERVVYAVSHCDSVIDGDNIDLREFNLMSDNVFLGDAEWSDED
jgi:E3 ubiquitin-protein ligase HERC2